MRWQAFDADLPILTCTYSFGPGIANALAVRGADGLLVVSPPFGAAPEVCDELGRFGAVRALVASNAFHYLGIPEWKARFPDARVFAPAQSIARVARRTGISDIAPLSEAGTLAGPQLALVDMPHYKTGELLLSIRSQRGLVWYLTDIVFNLTELPKHPIIGPLFKLTRSAPGLRFNNIAPTFMVRDKRALKRWLAEQAERARPRWLIPAHGAIADLGDDARALRELFAARA